VRLGEEGTQQVVKHYAPQERLIPESSSRGETLLQVVLRVLGVVTRELDDADANRGSQPSLDGTLCCGLREEVPV